MKGACTEDILGYEVVNVTTGPCADSIIEWLRTGSRCAPLACINPHSLICAETDVPFTEALRNADWLIPDGFGIVLASRIFGGRIQDRITGSNIFSALNERLNDKGGYSCFFLGADQDTLLKIVDHMSLDYPNIRVVGAYPPPYRERFTPEDDAEMVALINAAHPDVLWVGLSAPKQERWIERNRDRLNVKFAAGVGAVFDFYIGKIKRSPPFFRHHGLEWLPRLLQEPRRLWRRNFISSPKFLLRVLTARLRQGRKHKAKGSMGKDRD